MTTFAQLSARLKNFLRGWLLVLGLKEGLVECATVCVKSVVILAGMDWGDAGQAGGDPDGWSGKWSVLIILNLKKENISNHD